MGRDLCLLPVALAAYVSSQISPIDGGMSLDSKESHRDSTTMAARATKPFGFGRGYLGHFARFLCLGGRGAQQKTLQAFDKFITAGQMLQVLSRSENSVFIPESASTPLQRR